MKQTYCVPSDNVLKVDSPLEARVVDDCCQMVNQECRTAADKGVHCLQFATAEGWTDNGAHSKIKVIYQQLISN